MDRSGFIHLCSLIVQLLRLHAHKLYLSCPLEEENVQKYGLPMYREALWLDVGLSQIDDG